MKTMNKFNTWMLCLFSIGILASCSKKDDVGGSSQLVAKFSTEKVTYFTGEEIKLSNESTGGGTLTYAWNFGDGKTSTDKTPTQIYDTPNIYVIRLTVSDGKSTASAQKTIEIKLAPEPDKGNMELKWIAQQFLGDIRSVSPAVDNEGNVLMSSEDHFLRKFSKSNGAQLWSYDLRKVADGSSIPEGNTTSSPSIDTDGTIFIGTGASKNGRFYAITASGTKKWLADGQNGFWAAAGATPNPTIRSLTAAIDGNYVFTGNAGTTGSTVVFDKTTGTRKSYVTNAAGTGGPTGGVITGIVLTKDGYAAWYGGVYGLYAASVATLTTTGGAVPTAWGIFNTAPYLPSATSASMAVGADGTIYGLAHFDTSLGGPSAFAVSSTGAQRWKTSLGTVGTLDQGGVAIGADGTIYVTVKQGKDANDNITKGGLIALNPTGEIKWKFEIAEDATATPAIDQAGNIHFATDDGNYYILKPGNVVDRVLVKQDLTALILSSGSSFTTTWEQGKGKCWSSPVIDSDGSIYIGITNTVDRSKSLLLALKNKDVTGLGNTPWPMKGQNKRHTSKQP